MLINTHFTDFFSVFDLLPLTLWTTCYFNSYTVFAIFKTISILIYIASENFEGY